MPLITTLPKVRLCRAIKGSTTCAAGFPICEGIRGAVTQLPIAHSSLGNIDKEGDTGRKDADESSSDPPGTSIEGRDESITYTRLEVYRTKAVGVFDLATVNGSLSS